MSNIDFSLCQKHHSLPLLPCPLQGNICFLWKTHITYFWLQKEIKSSRACYHGLKALDRLKSRYCEADYFSNQVHSTAFSQGVICLTLRFEPSSQYWISSDFIHSYIWGVICSVAQNMELFEIKPSDVWWQWQSKVIVQNFPQMIRTGLNLKMNSLEEREYI